MTIWITYLIPVLFVNSFVIEELPIKLMPSKKESLLIIFEVIACGLLVGYFFILNNNPTESNNQISRSTSVSYFEIFGGILLYSFFMYSTIKKFIKLIKTENE